MIIIDLTDIKLMKQMTEIPPASGKLPDFFIEG